MDEPEEPWVPPVWPRYFGIAWLVLCIVGFGLLGVFATFEVRTEDGVNAEAVMGIVLAVAGVYYVIPQLRNAVAKLRETKES